MTLAIGVVGAAKGHGPSVMLDRPMEGSGIAAAAEYTMCNEGASSTALGPNSSVCTIAPRLARSLINAELVAGDEQRQPVSYSECCAAMTG